MFMFLMSHYDNDNVTLLSTSMLLYGAELFVHFVTNIFFIFLMEQIIFVISHRGRFIVCTYKRDLFIYLFIFYTKRKTQKETTDCVVLNSVSKKRSHFQ